MALNAAGLSLPIAVDERLRDRELGVLDLLTTIGAANRFALEADRRRWLGKFDHRPPGGESWADVALRIRSFLRDLNDAPDGSRAVIMCHDALVLLFRYVCERLNERQVLEIGANDPVKNVSLTQLERSDGGWRLLRYNDVTHVERAGRRSRSTAERSMLERLNEVTPALLRDWPLPEAGNSKYDRGRILVVGGAAQTPGAVQLAGLAALRVGAGHLTMAVAASAAIALAVAVPEAGVVGLPENERGSVLGNDVGAIADDLHSADVVIVGPGLNDAKQATTLVPWLLPKLNDHAWLVLDAYALSRFRRASGRPRADGWPDGAHPERS